MTINNDDIKKEVSGITLKDGKNNKLSTQNNSLGITPNHTQTNSDDINVANNVAQRNSQDEELMKKIFPHKEIIEGKSVLVFPYIEEATPLKDVPQEVISKMETTTKDHISQEGKKVSLTELWKKGGLPKSNYWIKYISGKIDIWWLSEGVPIETRPEISEVLAPVPSYEEWQPFTDPYFRGLTTKDIAELAKKSIRLTKQSCEDNTTIQRLKELLCYCADVLEELDDKDRDIEILLEEVNEVLA